MFGQLKINNVSLVEDVGSMSVGLSVRRLLHHICAQIFLIFCVVSCGWAQTNPVQAQSQAGPSFFFEAITYASEQGNKSRVDLYVQVPYQELRFVKEGDQFIARFDMMLSIYDPNQQLVQERSWADAVHVKDFAQTTSNKLYKLSQRSVDIEPGNYQFNIQLTDEDSRKTSRITRSMVVRDFTKDSLSLSDIMLVNRLTTAGDEKSIVPNISGNVGHLSEGFILFLEIYNATAIDSAQLAWMIYNSQKEEVFKHTRLEPLTGHVTQSFLKVDNLRLPAGIYVLKVEASSGKGGSSAIHASTSRPLNIRWSDLPSTVSDLDKAIDQMKYIARESEMQHIREAPDQEEKRRRFVEFWSKRNPDPKTERNQLMEEYYERVDFANKNFTHYLEGWRTDMGMVYIRFGPPDNIERHPFEVNQRPYEIWYYYQQDRRFIFVDESGVGDYRLRYPTTDLWGRVR